MAKLTDEDRADIVRLVGQGKAISVLAEDFRVSEQTIRNVVKQGAAAAKKAARAERPVADGNNNEDTHPASGGGIGPENPEAIKTGSPISGQPRYIKVDISATVERINTNAARSSFRKAVADLSQALLRDEITEALAEFFPEKAL